MDDSGGGGGSYIFTPQNTEDQIDSANENTSDADYEAEVSENLADLLRDYNNRDAQEINDRLNEVTGLLEDYLDSSIDLLFGGSVSKYTFINGISDVDSLMRLKETIFASESPQELLQEFENLLNRTLDPSINVERGQLAITLTFQDGMQLQLLPALQTANGLRIAASEGDSWSNVIYPERFARQLTAVNQKLSGRVVPIIKLAKGAIENLELGSDLRGYHIEAMAVKAFQNYAGPINPKALLQHFFEHASGQINSPTQDSTGQSVYIDSQLGPSNSPQRQHLSQELGRIAQRMSEADSARSVGDWLDCIGE